MADSSTPQSCPDTTSRARSRLRAMSHTTVVIVAAIGSIATSPARWHVATAPVPKASSGKGQLVTIEASAEPSVTVQNGSGSRRVFPEGNASAWTGRADYFIPPSETMSSAEIVGTCSGGFCSKCEAPPGVFARVASTVEVVPWVIEASSKQENFEISGPDSRPSYRVVVAATRAPAFTVKQAAPIAGGFVASEAPGNPFVDPKDDPKSGLKRYAFSVSWYKNSEGAAASISGAWTPTVTISGYCKEPEPCVAPNSERVTIVSVEGPSGSSTAPVATTAAAPVGSAGP